MVRVYRKLLALYPIEYRQRFGEEMVDVFLDVRAHKTHQGPLDQSAFWVRELIGLVNGALRERLRSIGAQSGLSLYTRRFVMRDGFHFPKTTTILMTIILAGVVLAIKRGEDIAASLPHVSPPIGPIQPTHSILLPGIPIMLAAFYVLGLAGWGILFALRRSGVHRLDDMAGERKN